jgi:hypothetical protein
VPVISRELFLARRMGRRFAYSRAMDQADDDDTLVVNCGRCGKRLMVRLCEILDKRTIDCTQCENTLLRREDVTPRPDL